ncbi:hypothetical protein AB4072_07180 [Microvirga sp. 2MCAF38]|uniref:hypothetical protein n=1 Tax=Microvirga sp. 2MCAF38 TaxID=3232989 RepID=UPI003F9B1D16
MSLLSRRSLLAGLLAGSSLAVAGCTATGLSSDGQAFPQSFSAFAVDIGPLKEKGLGPFADLIGAATLAELQRAFADRFDPRGPRLVVRLTSVFMTPFPDSGGGRRWHEGGGSGSDSLEGDTFAVGRVGEIIAQHHQLAVLAVNRSMVNPDEPGRAVALGQAYVQWLRRQLIR